LEKGWSWFFILIVKQGVHVLKKKTFFGSLDHHQHHVNCTQSVPPFHFHVCPRWIELPSLEKPDESLALIKGPVANYEQK